MRSRQGLRPSLRDLAARRECDRGLVARGWCSTGDWAMHALAIGLAACWKGGNGNGRTCPDIGGRLRLVGCGVDSVFGRTGRGWWSDCGVF